MGPLGPMVSICAAPANRWTDGQTDGGRQKLGYVMSFADWQVSKCIWPPSGHKCNLTVTKMYWGLEHGRRLFGANLEKIGWKLRVVYMKKHTRKNELGPLVAQKSNCRALIISWHVSLRLRNVWCEFEKDYLKTLEVCSVYTKQTNLVPWWPRMELQGVENDWHLELGPMHIWCVYSTLPLLHDGWGPQANTVI